MKKYDGESIPVSHLLGKDFIPIFIQYYCIPEFGEHSGFQAPLPTPVAGGVVLNPNIPSVPPAETLSADELARQSTGFYYPKFILESKVAAHPSAFTREISGEGPFPISNMWTSERFHFSSL